VRSAPHRYKKKSERWRASTLSAVCRAALAFGPSRFAHDVGCQESSRHGRHDAKSTLVTRTGPPKPSKQSRASFYRDNFRRQQGGLVSDETRNDPEPGRSSETPGIFSPLYWSPPRQAPFGRTMRRRWRMLKPAKGLRYSRLQLGRSIPALTSRAFYARWRHVCHDDAPTTGICCPSASSFGSSTC
jgi:hypothetical protein